MELIGTCGDTEMTVALGNGRRVRVTFPPETIALRVKRLPHAIVVERTETGIQWHVVYCVKAPEVRWQTIDELLG